MIGNYFTTSWRNLKLQKSYAFINILGLSLGIACAILIYTVVANQFSFDNFHHNPDRIFRTVSTYHYETTEYQPGVPQPLGKAFRNEFDFAEKAAMVATFGDALIALPGDREMKKFEEPEGVAYAEPAFFDIFNFPLVQGDKKTALSAPNTALVTQSVAKKYFGTENAIGKVIRYDNKTNFTITGILKDIPHNTDRGQEIYLSYSNFKEKSPWLASDSSWGAVSSSVNFFLLLKPGATKAQVENAYPGLIKKYIDESDAEATRFILQPLNDIHFNTDFDGYASKMYLWALSMIGIFLIITACVNFVNLATAQALNRAKEIGVRKVMGSRRSQLFWQFIAETTIITLFAVVSGYGIARLALPFINTLTNLPVSINPIQKPELILFMLLLLVVVVFLAGSYPAIVLTRFQPILALKGRMSQKHIGGFSLRRVLVVAQFCISQMLIIAAIVIMGQMHYSKTADIGFDKESVVMLPLPVTTAEKQKLLQTRLSQINGVKHISLCYQAPASVSNNFTTIRYQNESKAKSWDLNIKDADTQYLSTFGLQLVAGTNFHSNDSLTGFIINETTVKKLGLTPATAVGKMLTVNGDNFTAPVTGVVKDFNNQSFRGSIDPVCLMVDKKRYRNCAIKVNKANISNVLAASEKIWTETFPDYLYKYQFLDERLARFYKLDTIMLRLVQGFAFIAIFIGCLGLYGLVAFMAVQRNKEIGVRKVLGAHLGNILWLFGKELSWLLALAFIIAVPVAWWMMNKYLQEFSYRIKIGPEIFALAMLSSITVAILTAGYRAVKTALTSPVKSLRPD